MNALVTGGAGFLGLYVTEQLAARGDRVRVFSRHPHPRLKELGVEWRQGDVRNPNEVDRACEGIDAVFHVAAVPGVWGPREHYFGTNTKGTSNVLSACQKNGVAKLIYTSSPSVVYDGKDHRRANEALPYPTRYLCHYPSSKAAAEKLVLSANGRDGVATVSLRPHLIWGPRDNHLIPRLVQRAKSGRLRRVGDGRNLISMSYVENTAAAHLQAAAALGPTSACAGNAYFINEVEPVNLWEWIDELLRLAGLDRVSRRVSGRIAYVLGGAFELAFWALRIRQDPPMTRFIAQQLSGSHDYDVTAAQRDFGFRSIVTVDEGMRRTGPMLRALAAL